MKDPYQMLANAIVVQAAHDYRRACKRLRKHPKDVKAKAMKDEASRFFRSEWLTVLTGLDGRWLLSRLNNSIQKKDLPI